MKIKPNFFNNLNGQAESVLDVFGIKDKNCVYNKNIIYSVGDDKLSMWNNAIERKKVDAIAKSIVKDYDINKIRLYISKEPMRLSKVKDIMGINIFENNSDCNGWLVFVNMNKFSNWAHECEYYFVINEDKYVSAKKCLWMPAYNIEMELINLNGDLQ